MPYIHKHETETETETDVNKKDYKCLYLSFMQLLLAA